MKERISKKPVGFDNHNHKSCISDALKTAEKYCATNGLQLTPVRRKVLILLLTEHRALGAYAILDLLREAGFSSQPPVAYRALDFLVKHGFVHKIERLNAFIACNDPREDHDPAFMICRLCDKVAESQSEINKNSLATVASATGFRIEQTVFEAEGICPKCVTSV